MAIFFGFVGLIFMANGIMSGAAAETIMQQIYGGMYVIGGMLVVAVAYVGHSTSAIRQHLRERAVPPEPVAKAEPREPAQTEPTSRPAAAAAAKRCINCSRENDLSRKICECGMTL